MLARCLPAIVLLTACSVGEVPVGGDDTDDVNETTFAAQITPLVTRCLGCHSTTQMPTLTSFGDLQDIYKVKPGATNLLVTKGDIEIVPGTHQGIDYFNVTDQGLVAAWIDGIQ